MAEETETPKEESNQEEVVTESNPLEEAKQTLIGLKEQNKILQEHLKKMQLLQAEKLMSGTAQAGQKEKTPEEKLKEEDDSLTKRALNNYFG